MRSFSGASWDAWMNNVHCLANGHGNVNGALWFHIWEKTLWCGTLLDEEEPPGCPIVRLKLQVQTQSVRPLLRFSPTTMADVTDEQSRGDGARKESQEMVFERWRQNHSVWKIVSGHKCNGQWILCQTVAQIMSSPSKKQSHDDKQTTPSKKAHHTLSNC